MMRFKIIFIDRQFEPWELHEWHEPRGLLGFRKRGFWLRGYTADTKEAVEARMKGIVEGERKVEPTYYDHTGNPDLAW